MADKTKDLSMLEIAGQVLESEGTLTTGVLIKKVIDKVGIKEDDFEKIAQFYLDLTCSAKFVFCGDDKWKLKNGNLDLWDKEIYAFTNVDDSVIEEDDIDFSEFYSIPEEEEEEISSEIEEKPEDEEYEEESEYIDVELPLESLDDDVENESETEYDNEYEDDYNDIMDDYENMYDKE